MTNEIITAALVNGLCQAWMSFKLSPFEDSQASMSLLAVRPLGLDFGIVEPTGQSRVYRLGLSLTSTNADIEFTRKSGNPLPDAFDDHISSLLLEAFETTVAPVLKLRQLDGAEETLASLPVTSREVH
jgi:hypothetical protein